jgi:ABC-type transporter Mla subunit MlaD
MFDFIFRPLRAALGAAEHEVSAPIAEGEHEILDTVTAIHRATESIEHHVQVIEGLATSVTPLTDSVNQLTATMRDLVAILAPMGEAEHDVEHGVQRVEHFFGIGRHESRGDPDAEKGEGS